jgi:hypothetical protein
LSAFLVLAKKTERVGGTIRVQWDFEGLKEMMRFISSVSLECGGGLEQKSGCEQEKTKKHAPRFCRVDLAVLP